MDVSLQMTWAVLCHLPDASGSRPLCQFVPSTLLKLLYFWPGSTTSRLGSKILSQTLSDSGFSGVNDSTSPASSKSMVISFLQGKLQFHRPIIEHGQLRNTFACCQCPQRNLPGINSRNPHVSAYVPPGPFIQSRELSYTVKTDHKTLRVSDSRQPLSLSLAIFSNASVR